MINSQDLASFSAGGLVAMALTAFLVAVVLAWRFLQPGSRLHILDHPNERSLHERPTPRSGGIAILIQLLADAHRKKKRIGITGVSDHFQKIFRMVGITKFAEIYPTVHEGVHMMSEE